MIRIAVPDGSIGNNPSSGIAVIDYVYLNKMIEKEFEKDNIKVEWHFFKGAGPAINEALVNKQIDFAFIGDLGAIIGRSNQLDSKLLMAIARQIYGYLAVQPNQGYTNLEALKGKSIAVYHGTASQLSFDQVLDHYGFTEKDFRIINLDYAAANAALVAKKIDAAWGNSGLLALQQRGIVDIPISSHNTGSSLGTTQMGLIADAQIIQQYPDFVQRVVNTVLKSSYWVAQAQNRNAAIEMVSENANYPVQLYALSFKD
ncbi:ABC transporter substrate-binding protein [Acinetobacter puyangensis]|uniref:ABC transporter substrate-binding protein n=1 Tax=Acinetobacter puyangensis TaxID=1096779 RepID=UPI003A4DC5BB